MMRRHPPVLMYHGFGRREPSSDPHRLFVPVRSFERQLRLLRRLFVPLDLQGFLDGFDRGRWPARSFLLTIDDGFVSVLEEAAPLLRLHRVPAVVFVPPACLGGRSGWIAGMSDEPLLSAGQVVELARMGFEIGAHGMDHAPLAGLPGSQLHRQVVESRRALSDLLGAAPRAFAYPAGAVDAAAERAVREEGYMVAFGVSSGAGRFSVQRRAVHPGDTTVSFPLRLLPGYEGLRGFLMRHPAAWRVATRLPAGERRGAR